MHVAWRLQGASRQALSQALSQTSRDGRRSPCTRPRSFCSHAACEHHKPQAQLAGLSIPMTTAPARSSASGTVTRGPIPPTCPLHTHVRLVLLRLYCSLPVTVRVTILHTNARTISLHLHPAHVTHLSACKPHLQYPGCLLAKDAHSPASLRMRTGTGLAPALGSVPVATPPCHTST